MKAISDDLIALLDSLHITQAVVGLGHDWGSTLLSRLEYYHPTRVGKLVYLTIAPTPFGQLFDLDKVNTMTEQMLGFAAYGYQKFMVEDPERAVKLLNRHADRMDMVLFAKEAEQVWPEHFCKIGGLENWLDSGDEVEIILGLDNALKQKRRQTFGPQETANVVGAGRVGYPGPVNWYISHNNNLNVADEQPTQCQQGHYAIGKDVLLILCHKDPSVPAEMHLEWAQAYVQDQRQLTVKTLSTGHFPMLESSDELNSLLETFLTGP